MWAHKTNIYKLCPYKYIMVYHEVRIKGNHSYNYIIHNAREDGKWKKKSKFIGNGRLSKKKIEEENERFKLKMNKYISEENHKKIEEIKNKFNAYLSKGGKSLDENFREWFFTELTYNSNAIEGSTMTVKDTFNYLFNENYNPKMWAHEQWFDRAHNVFLDWLVATGLLGLGFYLLLYFFSK